MDFNVYIESQRFNNTSFISELQQHIPQHFNETSDEENENKIYGSSLFRKCKSIRSYGIDSMLITNKNNIRKMKFGKTCVQS